MRWGGRSAAMPPRAACDRSRPGMLRGAARLNVPSVFLYGGTILAGEWKGRKITIQDVFEAIGARTAGRIDDDELRGIECNACPTEGSCAGMYTANTMASAAEALGMSLPGSASQPAVDSRRDDGAFAAGQAAGPLLLLGTPPPPILANEALEEPLAVL